MYIHSLLYQQSGWVCSQQSKTWIPGYVTREKEDDDEGRKGGREEEGRKEGGEEGRE